ncbi:hypothetical protein Fmac_021549 [Flemingia macrophylla]|uniref:Uncharacterized protein n=1 Tax=Flemingia macrophylla TaxID=520843 RepID=A0ABD1LX72_9FABA
MQAVGESVKKFYSDIVDDLLPSDEEIDIEFPTDKYADARFCKKPIQVYKERHVKADTKQTTEDLWNEHVDNDASFAASYNQTSKTSHSCEISNENQNQNYAISVSKSDSTEVRRLPKWYEVKMDVKSNLGINENQVNKKVNATKIIKETTLAETDTCRTSQSCEISNENLNQNNGISVSKPASTEVTMLASETDCSNEIEKARTKQLPNVQELGKSDEEKQIHASSSSSCVSFAEPVGEYFSIPWL